jgi:hypothetical protein
VSETKWTPGPWTLVDVTGDEIAITTEARMADDIIPIVEVLIDWNEPLESEQQANALLIAAAPELYEALERALNWLSSYPGQGTMGIDGPYEQARSALAKARGES